MIAWLKLSGTRRDPGDYSSLHLGMRRGCILESHRPPLRVPVASARELLLGNVPSPERPAPHRPLSLFPVGSTPRPAPAGAFNVSEEPAPGYTARRNRNQTKLQWLKP